ncbi:glycosyltransferase [Prochlorothrix hollandica]|uniref:glycosyltransferase n=1 Tax=Prochlorothrix hollandica TaxID=1223 RepID=UPI00334017B0
MWLLLLLGWGRFWWCDQQLPMPGAAPNDRSTPAPRVAVVIPARNEAEGIGACVRSLLTQDYPGSVQVILVDDQSDDGTAALARQAALDCGMGDCGRGDGGRGDGGRGDGGEDSGDRLTILPGQPLAPGWTGKLWALEQGTRHAQALNPPPDYLLLTDADIAHAPFNLRQLVTKAETEALDLASLMVRLRCQSGWERLLIPAFVYFFQQLYPFPWVNNPRRTLAAAAGGCVLLRRSALERIGGIAVLRDALIDDCTLAAQVKGTLAPGSGPYHPIWLGLSTTTHSLRAYDSLHSIWTMVARTAYTQLHYSPLLLLGTLGGMTLVYLLAPLALGLGLGLGSVPLITGGAAIWALMTLSYWPTVRLYGLSPLWATLLPVIALLYTLMTLDSARRHWQGRGGAWKGRVYPQG